MKELFVSRLTLVLMTTFGIFAKSFSQDTTPTPFPQVVNQNFSQWDINGDGVLSKDEIVAALSSRKIQGESAAAIVAIAKVVRSDKYNLPPLTKDYLVNSPLRKTKSSDEEEDSADDTSEPEKLNTSPAFQSLYLSHMERLQSTSRALFPQNLPSMEAIHQGLGDCSFVSTVGAMVHRDPAAVKAMFSQNDNGSVTVHLGNGENIKFFVTDADIALWTSAQTNGLWLTALEKAYRKSLAKTLKSDATTTKTLQLNGEVRPNIYEKFSGPTIEILAGHETRSVKIDGISPGSPKYTNLRQELIAAQREHLLIKTSVAGGHKMVPKIAGDHEYAILGYDKKQDLVHIWNPWGDTFTPDGPDSIKNGYTTKGGEFGIPLKDFVIVYSDVNFETQIPSRR
jgi:hypothetical protein